MGPQQNGAQPAFRESVDLNDSRGLTKREEFAKAAMVGLLASGREAHHGVPSLAVWHADRLLQELSKPQEPTE